MKKLLAAALSSTALLAAPAIFAQTGMQGGDGGMSQTPQSPPLTPSQVETSEGAIYNPPPIDHSGNAEHVTEKDPSDGGGDTSSSGTGDDGSDAGNGSSGSSTGGMSGMDGTSAGSGGDAGAGAGTGSGDAGTGAGDAGTGAGAGTGGAAN